MARSVRRLHPLGHSPPLLRRALACVANFFSARNNQLASSCKSCCCLGRRPNYRGSFFPRTRSRHSSENRAQGYVDLRNLGVVFHRPFLESPRTKFAAL